MSVAMRPRPSVELPLRWSRPVLRAGSPFPRQMYIEGNQYLLKIQRAGGFKQYEAQVKKSLAAMLVPKFPKIPAEVIPTIVEFWAHAGDY